MPSSAMSTTIHSERLDLVPFSRGFLRAVLARDLAEARRILGFPLPGGLLDSTDVLALRLRQLEAEPSLQPWLLRAIVHRERGVMVGHIGCHTAPGAEYLRPYSPEGVEFGFTVYPPFGRQGFAYEASMALMNWAHQVHNVSSFVLTISPSNIASQGLAKRLGFARIGSHIDEVDGLEDILERRIGNEDAA